MMFYDWRKCVTSVFGFFWHPKTFIVQLTLGNKVVINSLSLLILQRRSRPRSVRDCDNHSEASTDVNIFVFVEPVSKSKDYARSWIRIGSVSRVPVMVDIHPPPPPPPPPFSFSLFEGEPVWPSGKTLG